MKILFNLSSILLSLTISSIAEATITIGGQTSIKIDTKNHELVKVKTLADYRNKGYTGVLDLGTYHKVNDEKALKYINNKFDGYHSFGGCTSYIKPFVNESNEKVVMMGRNMDLPNSLYPAYVLKIDEPGKYKSINIGYMPNGAETFEQITSEGALIKEMYDVLPYLITDSMNEKGLILETNMRNTTDKVLMSGTNPGKLRVPNMFVARYLSDNAANIEEVLNLLDNLDVYALNSPDMKWHGAIAMIDASGRFGVLEFIDNKPVWHEGQKGQANYWLDSKTYKKTDSNTGMSRYNVLKNLDDKILSKEAMLNALSNIWYGQLFSIETDKMGFDSCSEEVNAVVQDQLDKIKGWQNKYNIKIDEQEWKIVEDFASEWKNPIPSSFCDDPRKKSKIDALTNLVTHAFQQLPNEAKQTSGLQELSVISYVIDNKEKAYYVIFFEQPEIFKYSFEGIEKE